jgi:hypothetical protein
MKQKIPQLGPVELAQLGVVNSNHPYLSKDQKSTMKNLEASGLLQKGSESME